ncbi:DedA family protein [Parapedobacter sp. ISTM3]|uniref:Membrane-associated protein n=1 Tax=Parapedobacter luteus TaxID=623280 RepID=A0A1T5AI36_9SPHI|nr:MULTISPECIES: DedA family protein [Parapedobacter]MBK1441804.1 DedA family protein [Parapedobacter sp. ISTM3]SKB34427.1 membrane-associated protein [Parapedobacter luteus]
MQEFWESFLQLLDAEALIRSGGFYLVIFIVFAETGLFFGFFLPGDYLLFLAGLFCSSGLLSVDITTLCFGLFSAGVLGNFTGYWFGWRTGPMLFKRKETWLFKRRYVVMAEEFYHKYGGPALIIGRFVPIIRTFAPILAGIVRLNFRKFVLYNVSGAAIWVLLLTLSGFFLGREFPQIINYIEYIIIGFIVISFTPILIALIRRKLRLNKKAGEVKNNNHSAI